MDFKNIDLYKFLYIIASIIPEKGRYMNTADFVCDNAFLWAASSFIVPLGIMIYFLPKPGIYFNNRFSKDYKLRRKIKELIDNADPDSIIFSTEIGLRPSFWGGEQLCSNETCGMLDTAGNELSLYNCDEILYEGSLNGIEIPEDMAAMARLYATIKHKNKVL